MSLAAASEPLPMEETEPNRGKWTPEEVNSRKCCCRHWDCGTQHTEPTSRG